MRKGTITIGGDLETALNNYIRQQEIPPVLNSVVQAALRDYLGRRALAIPSKPLRITPARKGSGKEDVSRRHDEYLAKK